MLKCRRRNCKEGDECVIVGEGRLWTNIEEWGEFSGTMGRFVLEFASTEIFIIEIFVYKSPE